MISSPAHVKGDDPITIDYPLGIEWKQEGDYLRQYWKFRFKGTTVLIHHSQIKLVRVTKETWYAKTRYGNDTLMTILPYTRVKGIAADAKVIRLNGDVEYTIIK